MVKLSLSETNTLRSICDTIVPSIDSRESEEFFKRSASSIGVDTALKNIIEEKLRPEQAKEFVRLLNAFESRLINMLIMGRPVKFSSLDYERRVRYLQSWRDSRMGLKRKGFQAIKRLTCYLFYTLKDGSGRNPNWDAIGYPGPDMAKPVEHPEDMRIKPIIPDSDLTITCDVCVIGSGSGGSVIAYELSKSGLDVLVVEEGPYRTSLDFKQDELEMIRGMFLYNATASTKDLAFTLLAGRGAGGGTIVNWNTCLKPPMQILKEWEDEFGIDGVSSQKFQSYLDEVWDTLRVNTNESQLNWNNRVIWDGCKALGYREGIDFILVPRNAVGCRERCGFCTYGCIYSCKQSTIMNYLPMAFKEGSRFICDTKAEYIVIENGVAKGVECIHRRNDKEYRVSVKAGLVVAACGGLETPALLLRSGIKNRLVGKYLTLDPTTAVGAVFDKEIRPWEGPPQTVAVTKFLNLDGTFHGFWIEAAPAHPGLFAFSIPWPDGRSHKEFMRANYIKSTASIILLREWGYGSVGIDKHGMPLVSYSLDKRDKENMMRGMEETARILAAAGAKSIWTTHSDPLYVEGNTGMLKESDLERFSHMVRERGIIYNKLMLYSAHLMGSCRMSSDPSKGPTKQDGELYDVENLFIGDACVFPTTPGVNPMITIMAMAKRTSDFIKMKFKRK